MRKDPMALLMAPTDTLMPRAADSAAYEAAVAVWDAASQAAFAERADHVVSGASVVVGDHRRLTAVRNVTRGATADVCVTGMSLVYVAR